MVKKRNVTAAKRKFIRFKYSESPMGVAVRRLAFMLMPMTAFAATSDTSIAPESARTMDTLDVLLVSHRYMAGTSDDVNMWNDKMPIRDNVPLYDLNDDIMAYYISFESGGYAIVNNNLENPIPIEFGEGDNGPIREILDNEAKTISTTTTRICYICPNYSFDKAQAVIANSEINREQLNKEYGLDGLYIMLNTPNATEKALHEENRRLALASMNTSRGGTYDFIDWNSMPSGSYSSDWLPFGGTTWAVMDDYTGKTNPISNKVIDDHCGATAATNLALYFATQGYSNLKKNGSVNDTFYDLHNRTGNGPVLMIAGSVGSYATSRGYTINNSSVASYPAYKTAIGNRRPCGILLTAAIDNWHWVVGIGYRDYASGSNYVRVVNGWENSANNFYLWGSPTTWSITQYWI